MNNMLIQECAILLKDCLHQIKKEGLLSVDLLSLLPIRKDSVPSLFRPLYTQVLQVLKHDPLLPTADGTFANATQVKLARGTGLRELINEVATIGALWNFVLPYIGYHQRLPMIKLLISIDI